MSIIYKIITVLSRRDNSSRPSGDDPFILRGLLVNMTRRFSVVTSVRNLSTKVTRTVGLLIVGRNFYFTIIIYALTRRMLFKYFAWRPKVVPVFTLTRLNLSRALVSMITCLAKENFESNLLGFILAQNTTSPTLKLCGDACCLVSWKSFNFTWYKLHFDRWSRSSADAALSELDSMCGTFVRISWLNNSILGDFPLIWCGLCTISHKNFR